MSSPVCRTGDLVVGVCNAHTSPRNFTGTWVVGSSTVTSDGSSVVRTGDIGFTDCGHTIMAISGSNIVIANSVSIVRVGDPVVVVEGGSGTAISGSSFVTSA